MDLYEVNSERVMSVIQSVSIKQMTLTEVSTGCMKCIEYTYVVKRNHSAIG